MQTKAGQEKSGRSICHAWKIGKVLKGNLQSIEMTEESQTSVSRRDGPKTDSNYLGCTRLHMHEFCFSFNRTRSGTRHILY